MMLWMVMWVMQAVLGGPAGGAEPATVDRRPQIAASAPADDAADAAARGGARRRLNDGPRRRDAGGAPGAGPRRGERVRPGPPPGGDEPLAEAEIDEIMRFAHDNFPQIFERLERLRRANPREFQRILRRIHGQFKPIMDLRQSDPKSAEKAIHLQIAIFNLVEDFRRANSEGDKARIKSEVAARLRERFDLRQDRARQEIENLRKRLDEQERRLAEREQNKEEFLRQELERTLKGQRSRLDRPSGPGPAGPRPDSGV